MRVRLLNDGGYNCLNGMNFPITVDALMYNEKVVDVAIDELMRIGAKGPILSSLSFIVGAECEVIE